MNNTKAKTKVSHRRLDDEKDVMNERAHLKEPPTVQHHDLHDPLDRLSAEPSAPAQMSEDERDLQGVRLRRFDKNFMSNVIHQFWTFWAQLWTFMANIYTTYLAQYLAPVVAALQRGFNWAYEFTQKHRAEIAYGIKFVIYTAISLLRFVGQTAWSLFNYARRGFSDYRNSSSPGYRDRQSNPSNRRSNMNDNIHDNLGDNAGIGQEDGAGRSDSMDIAGMLKTGIQTGSSYLNSAMNGLRSYLRPEEHAVDGAERRRGSSERGIGGGGESERRERDNDGQQQQQQQQRSQQQRSQQQQQQQQQARKNVAAAL